MLCVTGVYLRDITDTIFVILHLNVSCLSICFPCYWMFHFFWRLLDKDFSTVGSGHLNSPFQGLIGLYIGCLSASISRLGAVCLSHASSFCIPCISLCLSSLCSHPLSLSLFFCVFLSLCLCFTHAHASVQTLSTCTHSAHICCTHLITSIFFILMLHCSCMFITNSHMILFLARFKSCPKKSLVTFFIIAVFDLFEDMTWVDFI